jgi:hypothetical protein
MPRMDTNIGHAVTTKSYVYSMGAVMLLGCCMPAAARVSLGGIGGLSGLLFPSGPDNHLGGQYMAGGYTVATGEAADVLDNGWNFGAGVQGQLTPSPVSLRLGIERSHNKANSRLLSAGTAANQTRVNDGWSELFSMDLDAVYDIPLSRSVNAYVMAGGGGAVRRISLTQTVGSGGPYCNDWAGICDAGAHPGDVLLDSKRTGRWEWNTGVGLNFSLGGGGSFFIEVRYMEVETPVPTRLFPIRVGLLIF